MKYVEVLCSAGGFEPKERTILKQASVHLKAPAVRELHSFTRVGCMTHSAQAQRNKKEVIRQTYTWRAISDHDPNPVFQPLGLLLQHAQGGKGQGEELGRSSSAAVASSLKGALASLEEATELGDALVASSSPSPSPEGGSVGLASRRGGARTSGVFGATGDAMLLLAKLCEGLSTGDGGLEAGVGGGGKGREELASLSVKQYLRAMAIG